MGLLTDVCLFPLFTPAIPFRLETLGYDQISSLTGWLSAAYAGGLIVATFPFVWLGARTRSKRNLLLAALCLMAVGVLILMLVPNYAAMVCGRILQGASGAGIWTLGLALGKDFAFLSSRNWPIAFFSAAEQGHMACNVCDMKLAYFDEHVT